MKHNYEDYRTAMMHVEGLDQLKLLMKSAEDDVTLSPGKLDMLHALFIRREKELLCARYCQRKKCRYWRDPGRYGVNSCDYISITGKSRIAQIPDRAIRKDFARCPLYDETRPAPEPKPPSERDRVLYDWEKGRALYDAGCSDREISETIGCTKEAVRWWRRKQHLPVNGRR